MADDWDNYTEFKGGYVEDRGLEIYQGEAQRASIQEGMRILEIGFGSGSFLDHCKNLGCDTWGIEIISEMVTKVKANGHNVYEGNNISVLDLEPNSVD